MSNVHSRKDCPDCNTPDVEGTPIYEGEVLYDCPNCEKSSTDFDRNYEVTDTNGRDVGNQNAKARNRKRGFLW